MILQGGGRIESTAFEKEEGKNSMNPIVVYEAEIKEKRDEKRRSECARNAGSVNVSF